jgi:hypothetical protein
MDNNYRKDYYQKNQNKLLEYQRDYYKNKKVEKPIKRYYDRGKEQPFEKSTGKFILEFN